MTVAGKSVCQRCVAAIRARIAAETPVAAAPIPSVAAPMPLPAPVAPPPSSGYSVPGAYAPPPAPGFAAPQVVAGRPVAVAAVRPPMNVGNYLAGICLGVLAGTIGTVAWVALVCLIKFNLSLLAIGDGMLIGLAVIKGTGGRGGQKVAILSAIIALVFLGIGALLTSSAIFGVFCVFFGVLQAYQTPMRRRP
jgi:hypothetical protein